MALFGKLFEKRNAPSAAADRAVGQSEAGGWELL